MTSEPRENLGVVVPADAPDHNLYLAVDHLPPSTCIVYSQATNGAATFFINEGTVEIMAWARVSDDEPKIMAGDEQGNYVTPLVGAPVTLDAGDWFTFDRPAKYAYRNPGSVEATVTMAVYEFFEVIPEGQRGNGCSGGCRRR
jgi:hypothetical protein